MRFPWLSSCRLFLVTTLCEGTDELGDIPRLSSDVYSLFPILSYKARYRLCIGGWHRECRDAKLVVII